MPGKLTKRLRIIIILVIIALAVLGVWGVYTIVSSKASVSNIQRMEELIEKAIYSDGTIGCEGDYLTFYGSNTKVVADGLKKAFDDVEVWEETGAYYDTDNPADTGEQLGNWIDIYSGEIEVQIVPYENGTKVDVSKGDPLQENSGYEAYSYFTKTDLFNTLLEVKGQYSDDMTAAMIKDDPDFIDIYGTTCRKNAKKYTAFEVKSQDLQELTALKDLESLDMERCKVKDYQALGELTKIKSLWIHDSNIQDLSFLSNLKDLERLTIEYRHQAPPETMSLPNLANLKSLTHLSLYGLPITDISFLEGTSSLEVVELKKMAISDITPLKEDTAIVHLDLTDTEVTDISVAAAMPELMALIIPRTNVTDVSCLKPLKKVEYLTTPFPYNEDIAELQQAWGDRQVQFKYHE